MSLIRVAIASEHITPNWMGGVNYFRNLISNVNGREYRKCEIILIAGKNADVCGLDEFAETIRTRLLDPGTIAWNMRKFLQRFFQRDILLYALLKKYHIQALTHSSYLWKGSDIPSMPWIPDFQSQHLPEIFGKKAVQKLKIMHARLFKHSDAVLLSSDAAKDDAFLFFSECLNKCYVLKFSVPINLKNCDLKTKDEVVKKFHLPATDWFYLPNQFWVHKNHKLVIQALGILKKENKTVPLVVATGNTKDPKRIEYFNELMDDIQAQGLADHFIVLGMVAYPDLLALMRDSVAVVNPSQFEGWSTTVEEAKSMGKMVFMSNIDVHREQAPARGGYFDVDDPEALAVLMSGALACFSEAKEQQVMENASLVQAEIQSQFSQAYEAIVLDIIKS